MKCAHYVILTLNSFSPDFTKLHNELRSCVTAKDELERRLQTEYCMSSER